MSFDIVNAIFGGSCFDPENSTGVQFNISKRYGYVVLTGIGSMFALTWMGIQVGKMRKQLKINYPTMYSTTNDLFNCYQRAHQNTLENYPQFLTLLFFSGLDMPVFTSIAGLIWIASRISYAKGYYTGDPKKRMKGSYGYIGLLMLLFGGIKFGIRLLTQ